MQNNSSFFESIRESIKNPIKTEVIINDEEIFGPDKDATPEEIEQFIEDTTKIQ